MLFLSVISDLPDMKIMELGKLETELNKWAITNTERQPEACANPLPKILRKKPGKKSKDKKIGKLMVTFHRVITFRRLESLTNSFLSWSSAIKGLNMGWKAIKISSARAITLTATL